MLALPPFSGMDAGRPSKLTIAISLPPWLTDSPIACHIASATSRTFGRLISLENPPSSAYMAAGYELCRISHEAFECDGPGRIMTLECDDYACVASITQTPLMRWFPNPITYSASAISRIQNLSAWIDSFAESQRPNHLMLVRGRANDALVSDAVAKSHAASDLIHSSPSIPPKNIVAFGTAMAAKVAVESQIDDCTEPSRCLDIRRKADAIAGTPEMLRPDVWPAVHPAHIKL